MWIIDVVIFFVTPFGIAILSVWRQSVLHKQATTAIEMVDELEKVMDEMAEELKRLSGINQLPLSSHGDD